MIKILVVANNCKWSSWPEKLEELKKWYKPAVDLSFDLVHTQHKMVPFIKYIPEGREDQSGFEGIDHAWYDTHITPLAKDHDIVLFHLGKNQWKGKMARGWRTDRDQGPVQLQTGCDENQKLTWPTGRGPAFFQIARHEISHALYMIKGGVDNTHKYWDMAKFELILPELKGVHTKRFKLSLLQQLLAAVQQIIASVKTQ